MTTAYLVVTLAAVFANGFSGVAALVHYKQILPGMAAVGVPESWLTFPIGTLKTAGAAGLALGLFVPALGAAAAAGLILYFLFAVGAHLRARDFSAQFGFANGFLVLNAVVLGLGLVSGK